MINYDEYLNHTDLVETKMFKLSRFLKQTFSEAAPLHMTSELVTTPDDEKWLLSQYKISNKEEIVAAILIYKGSRDGWTMRKFHEMCDEKGPTLTIMKT